MIFCSLQSVHVAAGVVIPFGCLLFMTEKESSI